MLSRFMRHSVCTLCRHLFENFIPNKLTDQLFSHHMFIRVMMFGGLVEHRTDSVIKIEIYQLKGCLPFSHLPRFYRVSDIDGN